MQGDKILGLEKSMVLLTDLYQITMAYGFWKNEKSQQEACFNLFFRNNPFKGGFTIACGLHYVIDFLEKFFFEPEDLAYLGSLKDGRGAPLFEGEFLKFLGDMKFSCDVEAIPEGTVVFPHEPLLRIKGPIIQCILLETPLLNMINFQSLIATKASRINLSAQGEPVLEFGLRRAQGFDGALAASRAAYIGGCSATSNVLAGKLFGIPVRGTHAHSWVMAHDSELESFESYARALPGNCLFLVDTYNTLQGVSYAIEVGKKLVSNGFKFLGIRLDSGDLAYLSIEARKLLDEAGFIEAMIVASNDLDEYIIESLKKQGAAISVWGVGTRLATAYDQPALGGVYKLSAIKNSLGKWEFKVKLSEQSIKVSNPGILNIRRFYKKGEAIGDMIFDEERGFEQPPVAIDPMDNTRRKQFSLQEKGKNLLVPLFEKGVLKYHSPDIHSLRENTARSLKEFHPGIKRFVNPHQYPVGLEKSLFEIKNHLILKERGWKSELESFKKS